MAAVKELPQKTSKHWILTVVSLPQLFLFNYYPFVQRFIQPHQRGECSSYSTCQTFGGIVVQGEHESDCMLDLSLFLPI